MTTREQLINWFKTNDIDSDREITCDTCPDVNNCRFAFDPYCTDGDCLAEK